MKELKQSRKTLYTKSVIKDSLLELLRKHSIEKITVKEICAVANINRGTFYNHYIDILDLVNYLEQEVIDFFVILLEDFDVLQNNQYEMYFKILKNLKIHKNKFKIVFLNPDSTTVFTKLINMQKQNFIEFTHKNSKNFTEIEIDYIFSYVTNGSASVILKWFTNGLVEEPETMAKLLTKLSPVIND